MNLRQLKYFSAVVEVGNMTRAADQLHVSQTALGMQIRQLEEDLGVALLVRHSRGIEATQAGKLLHARALDILRLVDEARREVSTCEREDSEIIRLGLTPGLMTTVAPGLAVDVREHLPQVILRLVEEMSHVLVGALIDGDVDFVLAYDAPELANVSRTALLQDDLVLVTLPDARSGQQVALVDALEEVLAMPEEGDSARSSVARAARELGVELKVAYEVRSISAIKGLVARGAAASILPYALVKEDLLAGKLGVLPIVMPAVRRTLFLATLSQRPPFRNEAALIALFGFNVGPLRDRGPGRGSVAA
jgi:LysR family nitrogen assimilation transcriptional regulator